MKTRSTAVLMAVSVLAACGGGGGEESFSSAKGCDETVEFAQWLVDHEPSGGGWVDEYRSEQEAWLGAVPGDVASAYRQWQKIDADTVKVSEQREREALYARVADWARRKCDVAGF